MPQIFLGPCERFRGFPSAASLYHSFSSDQRENARARCPYPACLRTGGLPSLQPGADRNAMRRRMPMRCANCISSMWTLHCTNRFKRPIFTSWNSKQRTPPPSAALIGLAALLLPVANRLCDARRSSPRRAFSSSPALHSSSDPPAYYFGTCSLSGSLAMHCSHRCHSERPLPSYGYAAYIPLIDRAAHSSSQRTRYGLAALLLPVANQNKRRLLDLLPQRALFISAFLFHYSYTAHLR